jgi:hypothetical protein
MATIARLVTVMEAQVEGFEKATTTFEKTSRKMEDMSSVAGTLGKSLFALFAVDRMLDFAGGLVEAADRFDDLSAKTDIAVGTLQELNFAFAGTGVSVDQMASAVAQMSKRLVEGDSGAVNALRQLGLNAESLIRMSPDQAFLRIAEAIREIPNPMEQSTIAMRLFGRTGSELLPVLRKDLQDLMQQARDTGAVMSDETVAAAAKLSDMWERLKIRTAALTANFIEFALENNKLSAALSDVSSLVTFISHGNAMEDALKRVRVPTRSLADSDLPDLTMSLQEADKISKQLSDDTLKKIDRALIENQRTAERTAEAHRQVQAIIGVGYMKAAQDAIAATEQMRTELNRIETDITNDYLGQLQTRVAATQEASDKQEASWRSYNNMIGELLMEQDRVAMESAASQQFTWSDLFGSVDGMMQMVFGPRAQKAVDTFQNIFKAGRSGWQGILKLLTSDFTGFISGIMAGIDMVKSAWSFLSGLFGGGEEGTQVNPARDTFLSQWGDPSNKGVGGAGHNLAALLTSLGAGDGGGSLFSALQHADKMALFRPAAQAIVEFLNANGQAASMNFHTGGMVPGTGEVPATLLGGERVQSRAEVGDMRGMADDIKGLRHDQQRLLRTLGKEIAAQMQFAMAQQA